MRIMHLLVLHLKKVAVHNAISHTKFHFKSVAYRQKPIELLKYHSITAFSVSQEGGYAILG